MGSPSDAGPGGADAGLLTPQLWSQDAHFGLVLVVLEARAPGLARVLLLVLGGGGGACRGATQQPRAKWAHTCACLIQVAPGLKPGNSPPPPPPPRTFLPRTFLPRTFLPSVLGLVCREPRAAEALWASLLGECRQGYEQAAGVAPTLARLELSECWGLSVDLRGLGSAGGGGCQGAVGGGHWVQLQV